VLNRLASAAGVGRVAASSSRGAVNVEWRIMRGDVMAGPQTPPDVSGAVFDQKSQYDQIIPWLIGGERLYAVHDLKGGGTGFIAITNKRLMFYDKAFLGKRKALTSVPFNKITAVSSVDEGRGLFGATSELVVKTGSEAFEFEFRGGDKAQRAYAFIMYEMLQN
jgi:Bacterial PH domain